MTHPPQSGSAADTQKGNLQNTVAEPRQGAGPVGRRSKPLRIGSLFAGYGGSELAVQSVFPDATPAWFVEYDKHPSTILAAHWPDVPNYGDVTTVDWDAVEPVDILTAGWPCQPFSHAGQRRGTDDDRHLWPYVADALRVLRPRYLFGENVAGHLSLGFDTVLADLAGLGFDARWGVVRASDAGAPHRRARLFVVAEDTHRQREGEGAAGAVAYAQRSRWSVRPNGPDSGTAADANGQRHGPGQDTAAVGRVDGEDAGQPQQRQRPRQVAGDRSAAAMGGAVDGGQQRGEAGGPREVACGCAAWGAYAPAIHRWELTLGRPAPAPTEPGEAGRPRLSARAVEFMMGLPEGWVTDTGISHAAQLKALGNGIVWQQMALALRLLLDMPCQ